MKNSLLSIILFCCISTSGFSQLIANTYWGGYDSTNTMDLYWHFSTDTVSYSPDNINYTTVSTFTENMSVFRIADVPSGPGQCAVTDTGSYMKIFNLDTMWLSIITDVCSDRSSYLTSHYFIAMPTTINESDNDNIFTVMPNPTTGMLTFSSNEVAEKITVTDVAGRIIHEESCTQNNTIIDLGNVPSGIYFVNVYFADGVSTQKIIRQ